MRWKKVSLIGVGLLGGSLGLALRQRRLAGAVVGYVRRQASIRECEKLGAVCHATRNLQEAVQGADLIVLCTPIAQIPPLVGEMLSAIQPGAIITDVGSVKSSLVRELEPLVASVGAGFIGSHPMAGSERTGVAAASAGLFTGSVCVVTPTVRSNPTALRRVEQLWKDVGGRLLRLSADLHDLFVSRSSHLPYLAAAALSNFILQPARPKTQSLLCATGFRDTTRIASGSAEMWRDIALANRRHVCASLAAYIGELRRLQHLVERGQAGALLALFEQSKRRRDDWLDRMGRQGIADVTRQRR